MGSRMFFASASMAFAISSFALSGPASAHPEAPPIDAEALRAQAEARGAMAIIEGTVTRVRSLLRLARTSGPSVDAVCVDGALTRTHVTLRIAKDHEGRAQAAWARGDVREARWEMARLLARREMAREAVRAAEACVDAASPDPAFPLNQTVVKVVVPALPDDVADFPTSRR